MRNSRSPFALLTLLVLLGVAAPTGPATRPGKEAAGVTLLPNGWRIAPVGRHVAVGDLPLSVVQSPDGCCAVVSNNGYSKPTLTVVDIERMLVRQTLRLENAWLGLAWSPDGTRLYSSAGGDNAIDILSWKNAKLTLDGRITLGEKLGNSFLAGLAVSPDGGRLFVVNPLGQTLSSVDLPGRRLEKTVVLPSEPYTCLLAPDGKTLYVSLWGGSKILVVDPATLATIAEVSVGEHPNAMEITKDGSRLFVACANTNAV